ncbi:cupin domain-containing protein [Spirosoma foliorum]|uniref:Cupin domain-containing protein n=1 Tax=Spirosoma foliorum TaxID=2710596 RepID=A0A7G5GVQ6_9BACT|nr:cupin domain-containing protein [Spirosoma foliorum]QMW02948.1 cupin domain-containing protein [Spirosoma foliorum]
MRFFLIFWVSVLAYFPAFSQASVSNVYSHTPLPTDYQEKTLFEGTTRDYSHFLIQSITIGPNQPAQAVQQLDEEVLLLVKSGELTLSLGDKHKALKPGNLAIVMPGDEYRVENKTAQPLTYYELRYTSNEVPDLDLYRLVGGSFWVDWQGVATTPTTEGSKQQLVPYPTIMSSRVAMQLTTLKSGLENPPVHKHRAAEVILILKNPVQMHIAGREKEVQAGDLIFIDSEVPHSIRPDSPTGSTYLSLQF